MKSLRISQLLISGALLLTSSAFAANPTLFVGTCHLKSYKTISLAVAAAPAGATIKVCAGSYAEQVVVTQPLTLEGIPRDGFDQAIVTSPSTGMVVNAADDMGDSIAALLVLQNVSGLVIVRNLTFDASSNGVPSGGGFVVGIFAQNSPARINRVVTRNQSGGSGGVGVWLEGGASNPSVTLENSSLHNFTDVGLWTETNSAASELTATVHDIFVDPVLLPGSSIGIVLGKGSTNTISGNNIENSETAISVSGAADGTISYNNLTDNGTGIALGGDGNAGGDVSVTNNTIFDSSVEGILVSSGLLLPVVQRNTIAKTPIGIDYGCIIDGNIGSNTILDANIGDSNLPQPDSLDVFFDVFTQAQTCPAAAIAKSSR